MKKPLTLLDKLPQARFLVEAGIRRAAAAKLVRAGYTNLETLARASREDLLSVPGISTGTLEQLEVHLGHPLRSPTAYWREQGLPATYAIKLGKARIESVEALGKMSRKELRELGLGNSGLQKCEELLGQPLDPPAEPQRAPGRPKVKEVPEPDMNSGQVEGRRAVEEPSSAQLPQVRADWEALHRRLLEMLVPLQSREGIPSEGAEVRLRLALWNAAREVESLLGEALAGFDLTRSDAATGEALYTYVVRQYFSLRLLDDPGFIHVPTHTPEECQLRVCHEYGRWLVTWIKLEEDMSRPESMTRELLVLVTEEDGRVHVTEV